MTLVAQLTSVTHRFAATRALDDVSLSIAPGEVVALLGPNGAGKTTLVRVLLGLIAQTEGHARMWGQLPTDPAARRRVGAMLQVTGVPETLTVRENVHLFSSYYGTSRRVDEALAVARVTDFATRRFGELSGGQRQRALFALAICGSPDLLVLDEPTVGLDVEARRAFWTSVRTLVAGGCAVLLTTHYLEEADAVADRIVILDRGRVVRDGSPRSIKRGVPSRRIRCTTSLDLDALRAVYGIRSAHRDDDGVVIMTDNAEHVVRELLTRDVNLCNLEVADAPLEEAFLALTGGANDAAVSA